MEDNKNNVDINIPLYKDGFARSKGLFVDVYKGNLTSIVKRLNSRELRDDASGQMSKNDVEQLIQEKDDAGRTPIDLAW